MKNVKRDEKVKVVSDKTEEESKEETFDLMREICFCNVKPITNKGLKWNI